MSRGGRGKVVVALAGALGCGHPNLDGLAQPDAGGEPPGAKQGEVGADAAAPGSGDGSQATLPTEARNCGYKRIDVESRPADVVLVLDRSGSMLQNLRDRQTGRFVQKWAEVVGALDAVIDATDRGVAWGLKLFPHPDGCAVPEGVTVPVALGNHAAVLGSIQSHAAVEGTGSTPTREALLKAGAAMLARPSEASKYLILATDGLPTCRAGASAGEEDRAGAIAAAAELRAAGIPVFVLGIATEGSEAHDTLNEMAEQGGRARMNATRYYPVGSREDLVGTLETITGQIYACTLPLDHTPPAPDNVTVEVDGASVPRDPTHQDGWDYGETHRRILLFGPACEPLRAGSARKIQILYGCPETSP